MLRNAKANLAKYGNNLLIECQNKVSFKKML